MFIEIKNRIEKELSGYILGLKRSYSLNKLSPLLINYIKEFICRDGKRIRPILFVAGYLGFAKKSPPPGLYRSALSIELLHDFMLVHDDIIDKSDTRRGKPAMHALFNKYLLKYKGLKFNGQDLTIVAGDVMYALALESFLSIKEDPLRKEAALRQLIRAALYTGSGEFIELLAGAKDIGKITKEEIYKIYDYKTAYYTFASPLAIGAILAGAKTKEVDKLIDYGMNLGRAFQIKDDILGMFSDEKEIGKSILSDLQEAKKTLLIWYAYRNAGKDDRLEMTRILNKKTVVRKDLLKMREIIANSRALDYAKREVLAARKKAESIISSCRIKPAYKNFLKNYCAKILEL